MNEDPNMLDASSQPPDKGSRIFEAKMAATEMNVREMAMSLRTWLRGIGVCDDMAGSIEIALAEALNNVTEHAYSGCATGYVCVVARVCDTTLRIHIVDEGRSSREKQRHSSALQDVSSDPTTAPEGGFGWFLIETLCEAVQYSRRNKRNHLVMSFRFADPATVGQS